MRHRAFRVVLLFSALALVSRDVRAQEAPSPLAARLAELVRQAGLGDRVGIAVVDAVSGAAIFRHQSDLALNPASNMKLVTAAAALARLGPEFRMRTALYGRVEGDRTTGAEVATLTLRGFGDPSLRQADLVELARDLADQGVRRVGEVVVDASYFDESILPPAFEQQPGEVAPFRAATGAVAVDGSAYLLRIFPGAGPGTPARVRLDGSGYFALESTVTTSEGGEPHIIAVQRDQGSQMQLVLRGTIPVGITGVSYRRRIENPLYWAGHLMRDALGAAGIRTGDRVRLGPAPADAGLLAQHTSRPLGELITAMGKQSDNFTAEMVFRVLGAERRRPGRVEDSVAVVRQVLAEAGIDPDRVQVVNGSGLFDGNRISSGDLAQLLAWAYRSPSFRDEYVAHLAIGGVDGTLAARLRDLPRPRIVRAKTGTLDDVIALSGYVLGPTPCQVVAFSVLVNGARGRHAAARALCDGVARAIAEELWRGS
jgi:D-alanyl-D-alanine carboxypeptidase/D-alanyl-D-alanine-endopeptidase (penicillin-binding protein 4)